MDFSENNIKFKHFDFICRFCLKSGVFLKPIFHEEANEDDDFASNDGNGNESVTEMIENCTRIEICSTDSLPKFMCTECLGQLLKFHDFRRQCIKSDEILKNIVKNQMPSELDTEQSTSDNENCIKMEIFIEDEAVYETTHGSCLTQALIDDENNDEENGNKLESNIKHKASEESGRSYLEREKAQIAHRRRDKRSGLCNICGKMMENLTSHLQIHTAVERYKCKNCTKVFSHKRYLKLHALCHTTERKYVCDICDETYKFPQSLGLHKRTHSQDRRFECSTCHKRFYTKAVLTKHIRCHTGERPYKCERCGKGFTSNSHLTRHKRTHTKKGSIK